MAAVDLVKHKDEMLQAWKEVVNDKSPTNWALFTYDGQSYDLKLASKGGILVCQVFFYLKSYFKLWCV